MTPFDCHEFDDYYNKNILIPVPNLSFFKLFELHV